MEFFNIEMGSELMAFTRAQEKALQNVTKTREAMLKDNNAKTRAAYEKAIQKRDKKFGL